MIECVVACGFSSLRYDGRTVVTPINYGVGGYSVSCWEWDIEANPIRVIHPYRHFHLLALRPFAGHCCGISASGGIGLSACHRHFLLVNLVAYQHHGELRHGIA